MHSDPKNPAKLPHSPDPAAEKNNLPTSALPRPAGVLVVSAVVALEALALGVLAVGSMVSAFTQPMFSVASGIFLIVLLVALAAGLSAVSVNAFKGMRWTRSAAFVWQLLMMAIGVPALLGGQVYLGLAMLLPALVAAFYLFTPSVVAFSQRTGADNNVL